MVFITGTGKTRTLVAAALPIVRTTDKCILITAGSNAACDEISERIMKFLGADAKKKMFRMYAKNYEKAKLKPKIEPISNWKGNQFIIPSIEYLYQFRIVICTLLTSGCITRSRGLDKRFNSSHFKFTFIDEAASAHETELLVAIAGTKAIKN